MDTDDSDEAIRGLYRRLEPRVDGEEFWRTDLTLACKKDEAKLGRGDPCALCLWRVLVWWRPPRHRCGNLRGLCSPRLITPSHRDNR